MLGSVMTGAWETPVDPGGNVTVSPVPDWSATVMTCGLLAVPPGAIWRNPPWGFLRVL